MKTKTLKRRFLEGEISCSALPVRYKAGGYVKKKKKLIAKKRE